MATQNGSATVGALKIDTPATLLEPVDAPYFSAGSLVIQATGNDFLLTFRRPMPVKPAADGSIQNVMLNDTVAVISVSPQTAKDLSLTLTRAVDDYEKEYGAIVTPYTRERTSGAGRKKSN